MFWGASLMWLVDAVVEYLEVGAEYFEPAAKDMLNDAFLGISVVALALTVWVVYLLIKDPQNTVKKILTEKKQKINEKAKRQYNDMKTSAPKRELMFSYFKAQYD